jgi:hypothetical protein
MASPGEIRVIHHLSYPEGTSINDGISKDLCTVQYQTIDDVIKLVKHYGKSSLPICTDPGILLMVAVSK